ncbi:hydroxymethylglutaryl-CoA synthase [Oenococcus oeni]|uniref:hydroxymethylglutaryl-CoA synthase n=1 Tax=Oenococcus oeni TaxID=1247 RepID=UPI0008F93456|nr:hydroxymethylglutaryl-CoA synthase [Oenococcus oeni]OIL72074.1 hydroxymethylglutaryl-CoA synthase [Oenococcus oeni]
MEIGIDQISFFTPNLYLDLTELAEKRGVDPNKYLVGIGQEKQSIVPPTQDSVSMAANAASILLEQKSTEFLNSIDEILFASESGIDNSKSGAVYLQKLLNLKKNMRAIEIKQACYGGTFALMTAFDYVKLHPNKRILVVASDIARYGLKSAGEVTQGAGAVAMLVSTQPRLASYNWDSVFQSEDLMDFWRPLDQSEALVFGKMSQEIYEKFFYEIWQTYSQKNLKKVSDFAAFVFHLPFTKMGKKALDQINDQIDESKKDQLEKNRLAGQIYNRKVGNLYTGSLYLSLISLLKNNILKNNDRIAMFSYGSGTEGELYSLSLAADYRQAILGDPAQMIASRRKVSVDEYEGLFRAFPEDSEDHELTNSYDSSHFQLKRIKDHQRIYGDNF